MRVCSPFPLLLPSFPSPCQILTKQKTGDCFMIIYSINSRSSFEEAKSMRDHISRVKDTEDPTMILVGNKCDLADEREVPRFALPLFSSFLLL
jgi:Ras family